MKNKFIAIIAMIMMSAMLTSCEWYYYYFWRYSDSSASDDDPTEVVHISGVKITGVEDATATLVKGDELQLTAVVSPADTPEKGLKWVSENSAVAEVSQDGLVTAVGAGTTFIYVVSKKNASVSAKITVTVIDGTVDVNGDPVDQSEANSRQM